MDKKLLANKLVTHLRPFVRRIEIGGSIRRKVKNPKDIDIVIIPRDMNGIIQYFKSIGTVTAQGRKRLDVTLDRRHGLVKVNIFFTDDLSWAATLLHSTGPRGANIHNRKIARSLGLTLNQYGLFDMKTGKRLPAKTERQIYKALRKSYRPPELRGTPRK